MKENIKMHLYAFNQLSEILSHDLVLNPCCRSLEDCERTLDLISLILDKMQKQVIRLEAHENN